MLNFNDVSKMAGLPAPKKDSKDEAIERLTAITISLQCRVAELEVELTEAQRAIVGGMEEENSNEYREDLHG